LEAGNAFGYKHTEDTKQRMKNNYSSLNRGKCLSDIVKAQLRDRALNRTEEVKNKYRLASSKQVTVYKQDGTVYASLETWNKSYG
jgi:hypothetical protein